MITLMKSVSNDCRELNEIEIDPIFFSIGGKNWYKTFIVSVSDLIHLVDLEEVDSLVI